MKKKSFYKILWKSLKIVQKVYIFCPSKYMAIVHNLIQFSSYSGYNFPSFCRCLYDFGNYWENLIFISIKYEFDR